MIANIVSALNAVNKTMPLRSFDILMQTKSEVLMNTKGGKMTTLMACFFMGWLLLFNVQTFFQEPAMKISTDTGLAQRGHLVADITFPGLHCSEMGLFGTSAVEGYAAVPLDGERYPIIGGVLQEKQWSKEDQDKECLPCYEAEGKCCNDCYDLRMAYANSNMPRELAKQHPQCQQGCRMKLDRLMPPGNGVLRVMSNRFAEDRSTPGRVEYTVDVEDLEQFGYDLTHEIHNVEMLHPKSSRSAEVRPLNGRKFPSTGNVMTIVHNLSLIPVTDAEGETRYEQVADLDRSTMYPLLLFKFTIMGFEYVSEPRQTLHDLAKRLVLLVGGLISLCQFVVSVFRHVQARRQRRASQVYF